MLRTSSCSFLVMRKINPLTSFFGLVSMMLIGFIALPSPANARNCGHISFKPDPYGAGGLVFAKRVNCRTARKLTLKCGRSGVRPSGWRAFTGRYGSPLILKRGKKQIVTQLAGATPPGLKRCTR